MDSGTRNLLFLAIILTSSSTVASQSLCKYHIDLRNFLSCYLSACRSQLKSDGKVFRIATDDDEGRGSGILQALLVQVHHVSLKNLLFIPISCTFQLTEKYFITDNYLFIYIQTKSIFHF